MEKVEEGEEDDVFCKGGDVEEDLIGRVPEERGDSAKEEGGPRPCHD